MKSFHKLRSNLAFNIISAIVCLLLLFGWIVSVIGYISFTNSFKREYSNTTFHIAETATSLVNGDRIYDYLAEGPTSADFLQTKEYLDAYCTRMGVSLVYVIKVDTSDYMKFTSIFNSVGPDTPYTPWEFGHQQDTTNAEYAEIYRNIYENGLQSGTVYRTKDLRGAPPHITTIVPIHNSKGEVVSLMCIQRPMKELRDGRRPYLIIIALSTVILSVFATLFSIVYIRREFVKPLRRIAKETKRFAAENSRGERLGAVSAIDEIADIGLAIDKMEADMLRYIDNLTAATSERERIGAELAVASTIQENAIPNRFPAFPDRKDFDIFASMTPAKEVGGDFYNFFLIDDDRLAFVVGDVSGKGIPAALFMMVTNILIMDRTRMGGTPGEILTHLNDDICKHNQADMFVTLWLGILEISTGKVTACNAGHDDAFVCRKGGSFEAVRTKHGLVVGAMPGLRYQDFEIQLGAGDKIFLYTDGVPEATDNEDNMFTLERTKAALDACRNASPADILEHIRSSVNAFVGDAPQFDDLTMLCIELKTESDTDMKTLSVDATDDNLARVTEFVDAFLQAHDCPMKAQMQIDLSLEEAYVNIAHYAYGDATGKAEVTLSSQDNEVVITLRDSGVPYNPLEKADPDITLSAEERQIGGLGIYLVKKNMDSVSYSYENGQNVLTMTKRI